MSAAMPPDALHSARAIAITSVSDTSLWLDFTIDVSWNTRNCWTSSGRASPRRWTWFWTVLGSAISP